MIPGRSKPYKRKHFREGLTCGVVGCTRLARHQWAYPCAINTLIEPDKPAWVAVCDECDLEMNRVLLRIVGIPDHVLVDVINRYKQIQGDGAYA